MPSLLAAQDSSSPVVVAILFTVVIFPLGWIIGYLSAYRYKRQYLRAGRELASLKGENFRSELSTVGIPQGPRTVSDKPDTLAAATQNPPPTSATRSTDAEAAAALEQVRDELERTTQTLGQTQTTLADREAALHGALDAGQRVTAERDAIQEQLDALTRENDARTNELTAELRETISSLQAKIRELEGQLEDATQDAQTESPEPALGQMEAWQLEQLHREHIAMQLRMDEYTVQVQELTAERDAARAEVATLKQQLSEAVDWKGEANR